MSVAWLAATAMSELVKLQFATLNIALLICIFYHSKIAVSVFDLHVSFLLFLYQIEKSLLPWIWKDDETYIRIYIYENEYY